MGLVNLITAASGLMLAVICFLMSVRINLMKSWERSFFIVFFSLLTLYVAFDLATILHTDFVRNGSPDVSQMFLFFNSLCSSMLMPMILILMLHFTGEKTSESRVLQAVLFVWGIYVIVLLVTQFTTFIYYFSDDNRYHRGPYYFLLLVPAAIIMIIIFCALIKRRRMLTVRQFRSFLIYILLPLVCMLIQMQVYGVLIIVLGTCVAALVMFYNIFSEQMERALRQREENAKLLADNRVLQMRPHFIYNTLMSIYYLCGKDVEKARQVILDFSSYLRKNFSAIASEDTIPFAEELEHTRAYLAVESARFEDLLSVEFDTPHTMFRLPPLTLQPVVENSVKHGLDPELEPLRIVIRSRDARSENLVIVEDNGPGFGDAHGDTAGDGVPGTIGSDAALAGGTAHADSEGLHIALDNIRERLAHSCGGRLLISSRENGGTIVTIHIPKK